MVNQTILDDVGIETSPSAIVPIKGNQSFAVQLVWDGDGTVDDGTVQILASIDGTTYTAMSMNNNGTIETSTTLAFSAAGNHLIQFDTFIAPFLKVAIGAGTNVAGDITVKISYYNN